MAIATDAYVLNLVAGMERTRDDIKSAIGDLMAEGTEVEKAVCARLHRTVGAMSDDLEG